MRTELHDRLNDGEDDWESFVGKPSVAWRRSKDEVWAGFEEQLAKPLAPVVVPAGGWANWNRGLRWSVSVAAVVVLAVGAFMRLYSVSEVTATAQHRMVRLPDGSQVSVNADSKLSYLPYWWWADRKVELHGEAFFEVTKGSTFRVISDRAQTSVLGTSFNVLARAEHYEVNCLTGCVQVQTDQTPQPIVLLPNQKVVRQSNGTLEKETDVNAADARAWAEHRFVFTDRPLGEVFDEVARQYGVRILMPDSISGLYTGNFPKTDDVAQTLRLICRPFGFTFVEKQAHVYAIEVQ